MPERGNLEGQCIGVKIEKKLMEAKPTKLEKRELGFRPQYNILEHLLTYLEMEAEEDVGRKEQGAMYKEISLVEGQKMAFSDKSTRKVRRESPSLLHESPLPSFPHRREGSRKSQTIQRRTVDSELTRI